MNQQNPPFENGQPTIPQRPQPSLPDPGQPEFGQQYRKPGPLTKAQRDAADADWKARFEAAKDQAPTWIPNTPTAWQSIPSPVRFAAWVWAISVIVGVAGAALFAVLFVLGLAAGMSSL